jgi:putative methanogenesis marker protein 6
MTNSSKDESNKFKEQETRIVVLSPDSSYTPVVLAQKVISLPIIVKTTCWGLILSGDPKIIREAIQEIRKMDPTRIFTKIRGYPPGDPRICRFHRGGGPRPGFHFLEYESTLLPFISKALEAPSPEVVSDVKPPPEKKPLSLKSLKKIIDEQEK